MMGDIQMAPMSSCAELFPLELNHNLYKNYGYRNSAWYRETKAIFIAIHGTYSLHSPFELA